MCTEMYLAGTIFISAITYFIGSYSKEKGKNTALKEDISKITNLAEKAKNAATIEDIGKITKIIEDVKSEFKNNNDILKSSLDLRNQHTFNLKKLEIEAYFEYNKVVSTWLYSVSDFSIRWATENDFEDLRKKFESEIAVFNNLTSIAYAQLHFFEHDSIFYEKLAVDLKISLNDCAFGLLSAIGEVESEFRRFKYESSRFAATQYQELKDARTKNYENLKDISQRYDEESLRLFKIAIGNYRAFTDYAKKRITLLNKA